MRWTDVDLDPGALDIVRGIVIVSGRTVETPTKTRRSRHIALDEVTVDELVSHRVRAERRAAEHGGPLAVNAFVFSHDPTGRKPFRSDVVTRSFRRLAQRAGLQTLRLHDLRHYVATQLLTAGIDVRTVAGRLGHAHPSTTLNVYAAFVPDADRDAATLMGRLLQLPVAGFATRPPNPKTEFRQSRW